MLAEAGFLTAPSLETEPREPATQPPGAGS